MNEAANPPDGRPFGLGHLAYALSATRFRVRVMRQDFPQLAGDIETAAELRELYRAAEARAARLRLLSLSGRELVQAEPGSMDSILRKSAERLALFLGSRSGSFTRDPKSSGFPITIPGKGNLGHAAVVVAGFRSLDDIIDKEDRDACQTLLGMMGSAIDRADREDAVESLLETLKDREIRLEQLVSRIFSAQEDERRRVAHDLHDGVAQSATALVRMLERSADLAHRADDADASARTIEVARGLVKELRRVIAGLRPTILDDLGLIAALHALADALEQDGYSVSRRIDDDFRRLPGYAETALYRVAQEAVSNIRKHAGGPCPVMIEAESGSDPYGPSLRITDYGHGPQNAGSGLAATRDGYQVGIEGMKERLAVIGGSFDWRVGEHGGVIVEARLPGAGQR
ncbi:histidine kinase [Altererythrobacter sp. N1]|nr:histidine kinase [Altererythrobacter sp. N1]